MNPVFYDCEASSLDNGYPIEIGWAWFDEAADSIQSEGHLIRPPADWISELTWDEQSESVHGIARRDLANGSPPFRIAQRMNDVLSGCEIFSDSTADEFWLRQLFEAGGKDPAFVIRRTDARVLFRQLASAIGMDDDAFREAAEQALRIAPILHRAEADARHLAVFWSRLALQDRSR